MQSYHTETFTSSHTPIDAAYMYRKRPFTSHTIDATCTMHVQGETLYLITHPYRVTFTHTPHLWAWPPVTHTVLVQRETLYLITHTSIVLRVGDKVTQCPEHSLC